MRIAVVGAGGLGGFLGALLVRSGVKTTFLVRPERLAALRNEGLTIHSEFAGNFTVQVDATDSPETVGSVDHVLFCVKTYDIEEAARSALPLIGPHTTVVPVQNGIDSWERIEAIVGKGRLVPAVVYLAAARQGPTLIVQRGQMRKFQLGVMADRAGKVAEIISVLEQAVIQAEVVSDVEAARWTKFVMVCATGGVMALTRLTAGSIMACAETRQLFLRTMNEVVTVAGHLKVNLEPNLPLRFLDYVQHQMGPSTRSSQLEDLLAGRRLELE
ncbi:MAG: 2-dehydropantoate 2-reductase, partial [Chloroflexi bacterium]|nr:2-dehydropantoate 2-reductase [Chloroflexota bacterium]